MKNLYERQVGRSESLLWIFWEQYELLLINIDVNNYNDCYELYDTSIFLFEFINKISKINPISLLWLHIHFVPLQVRDQLSNRYLLPCIYPSVMVFFFGVINKSSSINKKVI